MTESIWKQSFAKILSSTVHLFSIQVANSDHAEVNVAYVDTPSAMVRRRRKHTGYSRMRKKKR